MDFDREPGLSMAQQVSDGTCLYYGVTYSGVLGCRALSVDVEKGSGVSCLKIA
jgi:hypothetical protein